MILDAPHWDSPPAQQHGLLVTACVLAALSFLYACWIARKERDPYPFFVFVGAGLAVIYEPLGDLLTKVVYPSTAQAPLFNSFGEGLPIWMLPNYVFFFCFPVLILLRTLITPRVTPKRWWLTFFVLVGCMIAFEQPGLAADEWRYYGNQPFSLWTYPVWVGFGNAQSLLTTAVVIHLLRKTILTRGTSVLLIPLVPMTIAGSHLAGSLAIASASYSTDNLTLINAASVVSMGCCCLMAWVGLQAVRRSYAV